MKFLISIALFLSYSLTVNSQTIHLIKAEELEKRLSNGKDTIFIINFWATWCRPCLKELPNFEKLQSEYSGQKLKVILLSVDARSRANSSVSAFVKKQKLKNEVLVANEQIAKEYIPKIDGSWTGSLPATLMVNSRKGKREFFEKAFSYNELLKEYQEYVQITVSSFIN